MLIRELFISDVTRDIPPVVYFHEQSPTKIMDEVSEYIITGGFPDDHPSKKRVPEGIHEQYVRLLTNITKELAQAGGPSLPSSWISGFYGSGKSSFAKLLGLALDGVALPDGRSLSEALLGRDTSPRAEELRQAWKALREKIDPLAVVFDIGGVARDDEHIHSACVRQVQARLGYCDTQPLVADFELKLERDGQWATFEKAAAEVLGRPWAEVKGQAMAEEDFSLVLHHFLPDKYADPMAWFLSRAGTTPQASSVEEATKAIADMMRFRAPGRTLFIVVDEVSQYIHQDQQRMLKLQSFVSELGHRLKGGAWILVTGQQKLEEASATEVLGKLKDRFKPSLRIHLSTTNIRDVVHKRLLQKTPAGSASLRDLFKAHRNDLRLFAFGCDDVTEDDFVECYPMLPGHIDLMLQVTTALRTRSTRSQGDDQAIRGLLQLLGELFRAQKLADNPLGALVTLDRIYEVQRSALDADVQTTMARIAGQKGSDLAQRAAKAVALLELIQETMPTTATLVSQCLFDRLDCGPQEDAVREALESLRRLNLLGYSEKLGYKIQSTSGEEWARERDDIAVPREAMMEAVQGSLKSLVSQASRPRLEGRPFPWMAYFSDGERLSDSVIEDPRDPAHITLDLRRMPLSEHTQTIWVNRSAESSLKGRILWIAGNTKDLDDIARQAQRSHRMVARYEPRKSSLSAERQRLLFEEQSTAETLDQKVQGATEAAWMSGAIYVRGRSYEPKELGTSFRLVIEKIGEQFIRELYPHYLSTQVSPAELLQLLAHELSAPSPKFVDELGVLSLDGGRFQATCGGEAPRRLLDYVKAQPGVSGSTLLGHFGAAPYGYAGGVVRACVAGLLRGSRLTIQAESGPRLTAVRDAGVLDIFEKDRDFKRASFDPSEDGEVDRKSRSRICSVLEKRFDEPVHREADDIAEFVAEHFPDEKLRLDRVLRRIRQLPGDDGGKIPLALDHLDRALEACVRDARWTEKVVATVKRNLDALNDGFEQLHLMDAELTDNAVKALASAGTIKSFQLAQLEAVGALDGNLAKSAQRICDQLGGEKPWRDIAGIADDLEQIRARYREERSRILGLFGEQAEEARAAVKRRDGFSTLSADQSHHVLRPIHEAMPTTTVDAVSPSLGSLKRDLAHSFDDALERANQLLDGILSERKETPIRRIELDLRNREVGSEAELDGLLDDIRKRVLPEIEAGRRVRIV